MCVCHREKIFLYSSIYKRQQCVLCSQLVVMAVLSLAAKAKEVPVKLSDVVNTCYRSTHHTLPEYIAPLINISSSIQYTVEPQINENVGTAIFCHLEIFIITVYT